MQVCRNFITMVIMLTGRIYVIIMVAILSVESRFRLLGSIRTVIDSADLRDLRDAKE